MTASDPPSGHSGRLLTGCAYLFLPPALVCGCAGDFTDSNALSACIDLCGAALTIAAVVKAPSRRWRVAAQIALVLQVGLFLWSVRKAVAEQDEGMLSFVIVPAVLLLIGVLSTVFRAQTASAIAHVRAVVSLALQHHVRAVRAAHPAARLAYGTALAAALTMAAVFAWPRPSRADCGAPTWINTGHSETFSCTYFDQYDREIDPPDTTCRAATPGILETNETPLGACAISGTGKGVSPVEIVKEGVFTDRVLAAVPVTVRPRPIVKGVAVTTDTECSSVLFGRCRRVHCTVRNDSGRPVDAYVRATLRGTNRLMMRGQDVSLGADALQTVTIEFDEEQVGDELEPECTVQHSASAVLEEEASIRTTRLQNSEVDRRRVDAATGLAVSVANAWAQSSSEPARPQGTCRWRCTYVEKPCPTQSCYPSYMTIWSHCTFGRTKTAPCDSPPGPVDEWTIDGPE